MSSMAEKQGFHSMIEFEKKFFPLSFEKRMAEKNVTESSIGTMLAKESLEKVQLQLALRTNK